MSRCFPYPPPGYTLSGARNEALIESIKLQKEKEKERKEKKEKRKEKKEKRKEKKERRKERKERKKEKKDGENQSLGNSDIQKHIISSKFGVHKHDDISEKGISDSKIESVQKRREVEKNHLEQSSLTEEHACPATLPVPSTSSESTENSKKRKRHSPPEDDTCGHGKVILIRLPSEKHNELVPLVIEQQQHCSTSGRIDTSAQTRDANSVGDWPESFSNGTKSKGSEPNAKNNGEHVSLTYPQAEAGKIGNKAKPKPVLSSMQKMALQYQNLFDNPLPPQIQESWLCSDDLDWLLNCNCQDGQVKRADKKLGSGYDDGFSCSKSSGSWPHAKYLPEVDVYALPFTVPY